MFLEPRLLVPGLCRVSSSAGGCGAVGVDAPGLQVFSPFRRHLNVSMILTYIYIYIYIASETFCISLCNSRLCLYCNECCHYIRTIVNTY